MLKDYTDKPILITGAARSGTSMVAACVHICGAWKGETGGNHRYNAKGMFENLPLRQNIVKPFLKHEMQVDQLGQFPLPETENVIIPHDFKERVIAEITKQGWTPDKPWMYKCAKMSLIWPVWRYAFPNSKWVIVRRRKADIVHSCKNTSFMRKLSDPTVYKELGLNSPDEGWAWWVEQHEKKFNEIINSGINAKVIWPEKMVRADYSEIKDTIEWLGLYWNGNGVTDFIEPKLWKSRK